MEGEPQGVMVETLCQNHAIALAIREEMANQRDRTHPL
jgi:hypothetical protein